MANKEYSYDVFLSHNSKDEPVVEQLARLLRDECKIEPWLDKWYLVPGVPWQQGIEEALDQCRTFAILVGPAGIGPWEKPEMQVALDECVRDHKRRVIPVLLPGAPDKNSLQLPSFLRQLTWVDFSDGLEDKDSLNLLYCGIIGIAPGDSGQPSNVGDVFPEPRIPSVVKNFLPYLADCNDQEYHLQEVVCNGDCQSPILIVVHGDEYQCLEKFRERLQKISLPRLMQLDEDKEIIKSYSISWPTSIPDLEYFSNRLLKTLSYTVLPQGVGKIEDIQQVLALHQVPVMIHATVLSGEWKRFGKEIIDQYIQFWQNWPQLAPRQRLLVFLFVKYENKYNKGGLLSKALNNEIETYLTTLDFSKYPPLRGIVLPRLNGVSRAEAEDWARSDAVKAFCDSELVIQEIREWFKDSKKPVVPMERLVDLLKRVLDSHKIVQERF